MLKSGDKMPSGKLAFRPKKVISVRSYTLPVHEYRIGIFFDFFAQFADFSVDLDSALFDNLVARAPPRDAAARKIFVDPHISSLKN